MSGNLKEEGLYYGPTGDPFQASEDSSSSFAPGQLGKVAAFANANGQNGVSGNSPIVVQAVKRHASDSATLVKGAPAYWSDLDGYVVTAEIARAVTNGTQGIPAGVFAGSVSIASGSYGFIQVAGVAPAHFTTSASATTTLIGLPVIQSTDLVFKVSASDTTSQLYPSFGLLAASTTGTIAEVLLQVPHLNW